MNFNIIKSIIVQIAEKHGVSIDDMRSDEDVFGRARWLLDYKKMDEDDAWMKDCYRVAESVNLYREALIDRDWLAVCKGFMLTALGLTHLAGYFRSFAGDLDTIMKSSSLFEWPEIPDELEWPQNFSRRYGEITIPPSINLDTLREDIMQFAAMHGVTRKQMQDRQPRINKTAWNWDYSSTSVQEKFYEYSSTFFDGMRLYEEKIEMQDITTAFDGLIHAFNAALELRDFFQDAQSDISLLTLDSEIFTWPEFPDLYNTPEKYISH